MELKAEREYYERKIKKAQVAIDEAQRAIERIARREERLREAVGNPDECIVQHRSGWVGQNRGYSVGTIVRETATQIVVDVDGMAQQHRYRKRNLRRVGGEYGERLMHVHPKWTTGGSDVRKVE